ncbi:MAG: hypothetical protein PQJ61_02780 [Spirochaetales bacterium]|uniref:Zinc ribbon domain-containing protein n=1 Tax=Candidatus Thalassospirochaeta sargassi TaxID=3119039 RepID=A0AAJ1IDB6_9SPIO|nr:hypothetical protein [Spirochaetales bacterium]
MPFCPRCGVEVDYGVRNCPLCTFNIPEVPYEQEILHEEIELKNYYTELRELKIKRRIRNKGIAFVIIILIAAGGVFNNIMQDLVANGELTFSLYVVSSFFLFIFCMISIFGLVHGWRNNLLMLFIATSITVLSLDFWSGGIEWFWTLGSPLVVVSFGFLSLTVFLIKKLKPGRLYGFSIILACVSILLIMVEIILDLYIGELELQWSLQSLIPNGSLALLCMAGRQLVNRDFFHKLKRYLHF